MAHLPSLVYDLAFILITAGVITLLFKWLKQPLVLGYIVAGILTGPYLNLLPFSLSDTSNVQTWAEIGVIFLLFALGLEFSFKKLASVGKPAILTAVIEVLGMMGLGYLTGHFLGWTSIDSLFLGCMLSMSSTTIIIKAFTDLSIREQAFTKIVFGILVVEDLVAIVMMVLLSTLTTGAHVDGEMVFSNITRLIYFLTLWFLAGIFMIPSLLKLVKKHLSDETLLIVSIGLCLTMVVVAVNTGFSAALGAFIMGSILAETIHVKRIEHVVEPLKNLFGAVFFISVGMMVDPASLLVYWKPILVVSLVTLIGKLIISTLGVLLSGERLKTSMQSGFSLAQIGEFAFIIATLGISLGVMSEFLYPIVIAVSVITTFATPYLIRLSSPAFQLFEHIVPQSWRGKFAQYMQPKDKTKIQEAWTQLLKEYAFNLFSLALVVFSVLFLSKTYFLDAMQQWIPGLWGKVVVFVVTLLVLAPFLKAIVSDYGKSATILLNLWMDRRDNRRLLLALMGVRVLFAYLSVLYLINNCFGIPLLLNILLAVGLTYAIYQSKWLLKHFLKMESRFLINLNERQMEENYHKIQSNRGVMELNDMQKNHWLDYKLYTCAFRTKANSPYVGMRIRDLDVRSRYNLIIIRVRTKENDIINIPSGDYVIQKGDSVRFVGSKRALRALQEVEQLTLSFVDHSFMTLHGFSILEYERKQEKERILCAGLPLSEKSPFTGKNLMQLALGAKSQCLAIGLERGDHQIVNPEADLVFEVGDVVWLLGSEKTVSRLIKENVLVY